MCSLSAEIAHEMRFQGIAIFTPPKDWKLADRNALSPHVKILVIGPKIQNEMPPTMNLMVEPYSGSLKSYLKNVKSINDAHGDAWKDLGTLKTKAGEASLSQVEIRSKWGGEKLMHAIIVKNGFAYVLTATAAKNEFGRFYQQFYNSLRSLEIYDHVFDLVNPPSRKALLENAYKDMKNAFYQDFHKQEGVSLKEAKFEGSDFQNNYWLPFKALLLRDYTDLGEEWQQVVLTEIKNELLN